MVAMTSLSGRLGVYSVNKQCSKCREYLPVDNFTSDKTKPSGLTAYCRACTRERLAKYRTTDRFKEYLRVYSKNYRINDSFKEKARIILRSEVKKGTITKPDKCDRCKRAIPLHGHHEDHSKPLEVMWLCMICHKIAHGRVKDTKLMPSLATKGDI